VEATTVEEQRKKDEEGRNVDGFPMDINILRSSGHIPLGEIGLGTFTPSKD
jgi:hypothetical protein